MHARVLTIVAAAAAFTAMNMAGCKQKEQPTPKPSKPLITADVVKLCIEKPFDIRREEHYCTKPIDDCCAWEYLIPVPDGREVELPAVGETLRLGQRYPKPPAGSAYTPVTVPEQGAMWRKP